MSELKRVDQILANLKRRQVRGGMEYLQAVEVEGLIGAFEHIRIVLNNECDPTSCSDLPLVSEAAVDGMLRGLGL